MVLGTRKFTFHLVPSGALKGKELLIGAGVAVDPEILGDELSLLPPGVRARLLVDGRATLVSPLEKEFDSKLEKLRGASALGTTKRGIGPAYAMRAFRLSPTVSDLLEGNSISPLSAFYRSMGLATRSLPAWMKSSAKLLSKMSGDVGARVIERTESGGSVLFEGSQGTLLDILHGSYPYVTSSHTLATYVATSIGIPQSLSGEPLGVMKCYTTRVGSGPFPTEVGGRLGERVRRIGNEYGATTGRPRRVGWLDLVSLRHAVRLNGVRKVAISKLDVLAGVKEFKICTAYKYLGAETGDFQRSIPHLGEVEPVLASPLSLYGSKFDGPLPRQAKALVELVEKELGVEVRMLSHGEERSRTIEL